MEHAPNLIVMLTHHDRTVPNAAEIFEACSNSRAQYWGFKEIGLPLEQMKTLFAAMRSAGKTTVLEVVAYDEQSCLDGAKVAAICGCDILMGTVFHDSVNDYCKSAGMQYMPFVGSITGRPSVLEGSIDGMIAQARSYLEKGAAGIDLLAYRYTGDPKELIRSFLRAVDAPVCLAGSIDSFVRLDQVRQAGPWGFTIGGAFFENKFGPDFPSQIDAVCAHMQAAAASV